MARSIPVAQGIKHHLDTAGDAELVEDAKQIILYRMLGEFESPCNLAIAQTLGHASNHVEFTRGDQGTGVGTKIREGGLRKSFENELQLPAIGPDLSRVYALDALGEQAKGLRSTENALRSGAKRFDHGRSIG